MNTYNKVPEVPIKPLNQTRKASSRRAMILKDLIPMLSWSSYIVCLYAIVINSCFRYFRYVQQAKLFFLRIDHCKKKFNYELFYSLSWLLKKTAYGRTTNNKQNFNLILLEQYIQIGDCAWIECQEYFKIDQWFSRMFQKHLSQSRD